MKLKIELQLNLEDESFQTSREISVSLSRQIDPLFIELPSQLTASSHASLPPSHDDGNTASVFRVVDASISLPMRR